MRAARVKVTVTFDIDPDGAVSARVDSWRYRLLRQPEPYDLTGMDNHELGEMVRGVAAQCEEWRSA
jgi:hypothetical protein